jgi:guanylate kinase
MFAFLDEILTEAENKKISARWELMLRLKNGETHRKIATDLHMSLCKITRGNKFLKDKNSITNSLLENKKKSKKGRIVIFSAPSGAGKSTILDEVRKKKPSLVYSISATTRNPRGEEKDGIDYFFMTENEFIAKKNINGFVEWAQVHGNYYGTPRDFIEKNLDDGKIIVMDIDVQGKMLLCEQYPESIGIFIEAPSGEELEKRLRKRGTDNENTILLRLENAKEEREFAKTQGKYDYFITNEILDEAVGIVCKILSNIKNAMRED